VVFIVGFLFVALVEYQESAIGPSWVSSLARFFRIHMLYGPFRPALIAEQFHSTDALTAVLPSAYQLASIIAGGSGPINCNLAVSEHSRRGNGHSLGTLRSAAVYFRFIATIFMDGILATRDMTRSTKHVGGTEKGLGGPWPSVAVR